MNKKTPFSVSLVVPTYNLRYEATPKLQDCLKILEDYCNDYELVISDDCSTDGSAEILKKEFSKNKKIRLYIQKNNLGIAKNFKFLYESAKKDYILTFAADGDYFTHDIERILNFRIKNKCDIVIGKRNKKNGYTFYRRFMSSMFRILPIIFFQIDVLDAGSIKLIRREALPKPIISDSLFLEAEIIINAKRKGFNVLSLPISYKKVKKISGSASKFSLASSAFFDLIKYRLY